MSAGTPALQKTFRALGVPAYRTLWSSLMGTWLANQMQQVARGYLAFELTHSALAVGEVTLAMGLPRIVFSALGGALADRLPKRLVLLSTQVLQAVLAGGAAYLVWRGEMTFDWLLVLGLLQGTGFSINVPVRQALVPELSGGPDNLPNAVALNSAGMNVCRLVGPSLAGVLIGLPAVGLTGTFGASALCFVGVVAAVYRLPALKPAARVHQRLDRDITDGFRYLFGKPALVALMSLGFIPLAVGYPYVNLMPVFALHVLRNGASGLGLMLTLVGLGGLAGTLATAYLSDRPDRAAVQLRLGTVFGCALVGFAGSAGLHFMPGVVVCLLAAGFAGDSYLALNSTLIMLHTDRAMYGRVMGSYMIMQSMRQISVVPVGALADAIGAPVTFVLTGACVALFVSGVRLWYPRYREIG